MVPLRPEAFGGRTRRHAIAAASALLAGAAVACGPPAGAQQAHEDAAQDSLQDTKVEGFLHRHWQRPVAPQGPPPADFTPIEAALDPQACGTCHTQRHRQWRTSRHAHAMGPGVLGQLRAFAPGTAETCLSCHAPMSEQRDRLAAALGWPGAPDQQRGHVPADLHRDGLACPACHLRRHARYGPPRADPVPASKAPHGGFVGRRAFRDSRFCRTCHQFPDDGRRLHGKLLEDTYTQWRSSRYAAAGVQCQDCHMPDSSHRWPGVHDPEMVQNAVQSTLDLARKGDQALRVAATVRNAGAGHKLPTYLTAQLWAELVLRHPDGAERKLARQPIGWLADVTLETERLDTRLAPGERARVTAVLDDPPETGAIVLRLAVAPQEFYERFYRARLARDGLDAGTRRALRRALDDAESARFTLSLRRRPLAPARRQAD